MSKICFIILLFLVDTTFAKTIDVHVKGMVCGFCAQGITKKFKEISDIQTIDVSLEKKIVTLVTKEKSDIKDDEINKILKDAGYNVEKIDRK